MRYGVFSDVHANLDALEAVLAHFEREAVDAHVFLGDAVGYGACPNEVCDLIRPLAKVAVLGNHDAVVCGRSSPDDYYDAARHALDYTSARLSGANVEWLRQLPYKHREGEVDFCHGAPLDPEAFDYLFDPEQLGYASEGELAPLTLIGHSHMTIAFRVAPAGVEQVLATTIDYGSVCHVVTAGSVGQPRDRDPRACCGILDTERRTFSFQRVVYDVMRARSRILEAGLPPVFGERLLVGM